MKEKIDRTPIVLVAIFILPFALLLTLIIRQNNRESQYIYTMTVDIYYTSTPERDIFISDGVPIIYRCSRGTNTVVGDETFVNTSAPVKVVSNTKKKKL